MKKIKNWFKFFESVNLSDKEKWEVGFRVLDAAKDIWGDLNTDVFIQKHGTSVQSELLRKSKNNRNLLYYLNGLSNATSKKELENWIMSNHFNIFHPDGVYFNKVMDILTSSSIKGDEMEKLALSALRSYYRSIGKKIFTFKPSEEKDIQGFDIFFREGKDIKSAQVKTLRRVYPGEKWTKVFCSGHITDMNTNYLIVVNEKECYIFNSRIYYKNENYYSVPSNSQLYHEVFEKKDSDNLPF